ncbi:MAG: nucleoside triphosphate pyrophosphohydrolase [Candidatus Gracilibacteria bacterium]|nr:nucleoside triphosphate pyrophosphohydrolase [Candidatus Gracilibacteria bacterium]
MKYNKLVRDKVPDKIIANGEISIHHIADDAEYYEKLITKANEEYNEVINASNDKLIEEIGDFKEVILSILQIKPWILEKEIYQDINKRILVILDIMLLNKITEDQVELSRQDKKAKLGGFEKRIILDETL